VYLAKPSKGLQKIVADFCALRRKDGPRERLTTILKKAIDLIELVDTRYPNLSHISVVAGKQVNFFLAIFLANFKSRRSSSTVIIQKRAGSTGSFGV
jgi:hypothetical protein